MIKVYDRAREREGHTADENDLLGKSELSGVRPTPRGIPHIKMTFDIDASGILDLTAVEKSAGKEK
jgi:molecular chaperone DnaK (HSP70)